VGGGGGEALTLGQAAHLVAEHPGDVGDALDLALVVEELQAQALGLGGGLLRGVRDLGQHWQGSGDANFKY
jgi:hypothetical protein